MENFKLKKNKKKGKGVRIEIFFFLNFLNLSKDTGCSLPVAFIVQNLGNEFLSYY